MKKSKLQLSVTALVAISAAAAVADPQSAAGAQRDILPMSEIVTRIEKEHAGRVIDIELDRELMGDQYEIELVDAQGKSWDIDLDARTGELLRKREDWDD